MAAGDSTGAAGGREYVVVARRYRPQDFGELIGQQQVTQALCNAIATNRVGHAYLFTGARGVGKTSTARILSKALNCVTGPTATPCHKCDICLGVASGEDVDVIEIDGASNRGIDEIRQLRANVSVRPSRARFKIYIIDEVHMLTKEAFNALLKTLEEPPEHVKFIFCTTDPEKIPITVLSRCQRYDFPPVGTPAIVDRLRQIVQSEGQSAQEEALELLARRAAGSMRDSQSLLEQLLSFCEHEITVDDVHAMLGTARNERIAELADRLIAGDASGAFEALDSAVHDGVHVGQLAEQLLGHVRDLLAVSVGCRPELLLHNPASRIDALRTASQQWGTATLLAVAQILDQTIGRMRQTVDARVLLEVALVRIASLGDLEALSTLIGQVRAGGPITVASTGTAPAALVAPTPTASTVKKKLPTVEPVVANGVVSNISEAQPTAPVAVTPQPLPAAHGETSTSAPSHVADNLTQASAKIVTMANAEQVWRDALGQLDGLVADFASRYESVRLGPAQQLVVTFSPTYNSAKSYCERPERMSQLERAVADVTGCRIRIDLVEGAGQVVREVAKPRSTSTRDLVRQSYNHPFVKQAMEIFDGEVLKVQPAAPREQIKK